MEEKEFSLFDISSFDKSFVFICCLHGAIQREYQILAQRWDFAYNQEVAEKMIAYAI